MAVGVGAFAFSAGGDEPRRAGQSSSQEVASAASSPKAQLCAEAMADSLPQGCRLPRKITPFKVDVPVPMSLRHPVRAVLGVAINEDGSVRCVAIRQTDNHAWDDVLAAAAKALRFEPARCGNKTAASSIAIRVAMERPKP